MDPKKYPEPKNLLTQKISFYMTVNHAKEYLIFVHIGVVFLHFLARASNGRQYSNFENKCPKLGTGTPEDMVLTNLGDSLDSDLSGFVLVGNCM